MMPDFCSGLNSYHLLRPESCCAVAVVETNTTSHILNQGTTVSHLSIIVLQQECSFTPVFYTKEGQAKGNVPKTEAPLDALEVDLENQIDEAMAQLNLTNDKKAGPAGFKQGTQQVRTNNDGTEGTRIAAIHSSLDSIALFGPASAHPSGSGRPPHAAQELKW